MRKNTKLALGFFVLVLSGCAGAQTAGTASSPENRVQYRESVSLAVGESAVIHGLRGACGSLPTDADLAESKANLDAMTTLGAFSFGEPGVRRSGACNGVTPVRETVFTAAAPGSQTLQVHGDPVRITVSP